jgi:hypothetical protein
MSDIYIKTNERFDRTELKEEALRIFPQYSGPLIHRVHDRFTLDLPAHSTLRLFETNLPWPVVLTRVEIPIIFRIPNSFVVPGRWEVDHVHAPNSL